MPFRTIEERYQRDPAFAHCVRAILNMIGEQTELTSLDIRDAAFMARLIYERQHPHPIISRSVREQLNETLTGE